MNKDQALKVIKGAFETVKKAATSDNYEDKMSILNMFDAFADKVDEAIKVLEEGADDRSNSDNRNIPDEDRSCNKRDITKTEMMAVLGYFQLGATSYERKILGQIMDIIEEGSEEK